MGFIMLQGPAAEPVPVAELRAYLRLDTEDDDTVLGFLGVAARLQVEALTGRLLMPQRWRLTLDAWPAGGVITPPAAPVRSIEAARTYTAEGAAQAVDLKRLQLDATAAPPRILTLGPAKPGRMAAGIEIDLAMGHADAGAVPAPLKQAIRLIVAHWSEERVPMMPDPAPGAIPPAALALIAPYRGLRIA